MDTERIPMTDAPTIPSTDRYKWAEIFRLWFICYSGAFYILAAAMMAFAIVLLVDKDAKKSQRCRCLHEAFRFPSIFR
ncbi:MAG: hypothetical protein HY231_01845 [Acidobacteria bacterium]|nr:hypothetical protein [Acidobacteriota bacterium]